MNRKLVYTLAALALLSSCKKGEGPATDYGQGTGWCRIISQTSKSTTTQATITQLQYNSDGRLVLLKYAQRQISYGYSGNNIYISTADTAGAILQRDTITYDGNHIAAIASGGSWGKYHTTFSYNGSGQLSYSSSTEYNNIREEFFNWSDGDMLLDSIVLNGKPNGYAKFEYYGDKYDQYASPITFDFVTRYGMPVYRTKHLVKAADFGSSGKYSFSYLFDADNKITTAYSVSNYQPTDTLVRNIAYQCK